MTAPDTLLLTASRIDAALDPATCLAAVERAFRARGEGRGGAVAVSGLPGTGGGFHVKSAVDAEGRYFVAKINGNFPGNPGRLGLPTIQGVAALFDATSGCLLALLDSPRLTALRTAAASVAAFQALARTDAASLLLVGCGVQARAHLDALSAVRRLDRVALHDRDPARAAALAEHARHLGLSAEIAHDLSEAARRSDLIVTGTPSTAPILHEDDVVAGTCIAAVGADHEHKQEIAPGLMRRATVVVDVLEQAATMGDLRGAIAAGVMSRSDVRGELGEVLAGKRPGRTTAEEIFVFDSTGAAFQDVAVAATAYDRSRTVPGGCLIRLQE